jgi:hypothetical protein
MIVHAPLRDRLGVAVSILILGLAGSGFISSVTSAEPPIPEDPTNRLEEEGELPGGGAEGLTMQDLEGRLAVLTEEVRHLKERLALPETNEELASFRGLGPAASKVYSKASGLSLGGYGEFFFAAPTGSTDSFKRTADLLRFITYVGYKFSDKVLMNTEIEFEHATTSSNLAGNPGSVSLEFSYLDLLFTKEVNFQAGNLLVPLGFVNEIHEPPFYRGNVRPAVEIRIIPTTWRELGAGFHGELAEGLSYRLYAMNGLDAKGFDETGIRGGRQRGNRAVWEDVAGTFAVDFDRGFVRTGVGAFLGGSGQDNPFDGTKISALTTVAEGHVEVRQGRFEGRALVAVTDIREARALTVALSNPGETVVIPDAQLGWYLEGAYDVSLVPERKLIAWVRYEDYNLQHRVPDGFVADPVLDASQFVFGLEWRPHASVVFKGDMTIQRTDAGGDTEDPLRVGAGFVF